MLRQIFEKQSLLAMRCGIKVGTVHLSEEGGTFHGIPNDLEMMDDSEVAYAKKMSELVDNELKAISNEMEELRSCFPWKWWKKNQKFNLVEARKEFVDIFHFVIELAIVLGFTPDSLFEAYIDKNKINNQRQDTNY